MPFLALALVMQIIIGGILLDSSTNSLPTKTIRHSLKQVLGVSLIAQDASTTDRPTDTPTPDQTTDTPTPDQTTQPTDTPVPTDNPTDTPAPTADTSLTPTKNLGEEQNTQSPVNASTSLGQDIQNPSSDNTSVAPADTSLSNTPEINTVIMNPLDIYTNTENISQDALDIAQKQDGAVLAATTAQDKTNVLISSSQNNIQYMTNNISSQDFTTTAFLIQRVDNYLQQTQQISQSAPQAIQNQLRQETKIFCAQADLALKTQQLQVPENLEQDVEIARGTCLNTK